MGMLLYVTSCGRSCGCRSENIDAKVIVEAAMEWARRVVVPTAPSRLDSTFVFLTQADAERFKEAYRKNGVIHRVKVVDGETFTGDMVLTNYALKILQGPMEPQVANLRERALAYWRADQPPEWPEVLASGRVEVRGLL
jgi:hypothetical protein